MNAITRKMNASTWKMNANTWNMSCLFQNECQHLEDECQHLEDEFQHLEDACIHLEDECQHLEDECQHLEDECQHLDDECQHLAEEPSVPGPHTMLCCTWHLSAVRVVWSALSIQYTVNLEYSNTLSTQYTRINGHSALSTTHLTGTECSVRAWCVVPCAPLTCLGLSLSLSAPHPGLASSPSSRLCLDL